MASVAAAPPEAAPFERDLVKRAVGTYYDGDSGCDADAPGTPAEAKHAPCDHASEADSPLSVSPCESPDEEKGPGTPTGRDREPAASEASAPFGLGSRECSAAGPMGAWLAQAAELVQVRRRAGRGDRLS